MSTLSDLLLQVQKQSPQLAADLQREIKSLEQRRAFGLNFERHSPESVQLPGRPIRKGDRVRFLAERTPKPEAVDQRLWLVTRVETLESGRVAHLARQEAVDTSPETTTRATDDLVVVAESRDRIYPGLVSTGKVERGGDKPFHAVINAENLHALQALLYTHEGKVDAIYIDPPYNTGAKDWKYNNDYVDGEDAYRHSKWLAFMERRLKLAKRLLNPENSVLIVTIDEKEYLRLGLLIEQVFTGQPLQMVTSVIAPAGQPRGNQMYRVEEYLFFVYFGQASADGGTDDMLSTKGNSADVAPDAAPPGDEPVTWESLIRRGTSARREDRPNQFFPFFIDPATRKIVGLGEPLLPASVSREGIQPPAGTVAVWPIRSDGTEGRWRVSKAGVETLLERGLVRVGRLNAARNQWSMNYLLRSDVERLDRGEIVTTGWTEQGTPILRRPGTTTARQVRPKTVWNRESHNAGNYGTALLRQFIPGRTFPFPKSLYAVEDTLRFFVARKPDAIVVDFFSGSGTTAHALMRLNRQDGGRRRSICITNNEVSADEQVSLRNRGLRPGDDEWEALGICDYITKPRLLAAVTGMTPENKPVAGDYKFIDEFPISEGFEENVEFFTMTYEAQRSVAHHKSFEAIAPLLWLKAGATGRRVDVPTESFDVADAYGVLFDLDHTNKFIAELAATPEAQMAFIVTDDDRGFQMVCADLPPRVEAVRLYSSYLTNFTINVGRE